MFRSVRVLKAKQESKLDFQYDPSHGQSSLCAWGFEQGFVVRGLEFRVQYRGLTNYPYMPNECNVGVSLS